MASTDLDMFSLLPESLLPTIVSCLPFKEAARTSILSKRWLEIWKSTKNIDFNELFFVKPNEYSDHETKQAQRMAFLNFITHFLSHYTHSVVDNFSLKVSDPESCREIVERCLAFASTHGTGVKGLSLDFSDPKWEKEIHNFEHRAPLWQLPTNFYGLGRTSLESLKLYSCGYAMPDLLNFDGLKDVSLGYVEVRITTIRTLLSTCRRIENLSLKKCWNLAHFNLGDEPLGLKRLVVDKCHIGDGDYFRLVAPKLEFFKYSGKVTMFLIDRVWPDVMEEAEIDFAFETEFDECGDELYKLIGDLYATKVLRVCSFVLQTLPSGEEPVRILFDLNVRHLILNTQMHAYELCGFMYLLNSCPMLEKITLEIAPQLIFPDYEPPYKIDLKNFWVQPRLLPKCLKNTLKVVEINEFRGTWDELSACNYFIQAGIVLKEININLWKKDDGNIEGRRRLAQCLLNIPRISKNLKITIA